MPRMILKPDADRDLYVFWSTITDGPLDHGSAAGLLARHGDVTPDRIERADAYGSSTVPPWNFGHWDDKGFIVRWDNSGNRELGDRWLPRENLAAWIETGDESLVEPLDD